MTPEPNHVTTIDQHRGDHSGGLPVVELHEVRTAFADYADGKRWEDLTDADRGWWADAIADIHAARVELAELPADRRARANEIAGAESCDLEDLAGVLRRAVAEAKRDDDARTDTARERTAYAWAKNEQGYTGTYAEWLAMPAADRAEHEDGAAGIGTV